MATAVGSELMVQALGLRKEYNRVNVLGPIDLEVRRGETLALIGPSGCGKSTLLRSLLGLVTPDAGSIAIGGQNLTPGSLRAIRLETGYVVQDGGLFPHLTGEQNVSLVARHLGWSGVSQAKRVGELAALVQLRQDFLRRYPGELSGGQRQRVSLMRALMLDPDLLLLDEPLAALDPMVRYELQKDLKILFERLKKTVILVTHDMAEAAYLASRLVLMRGGLVVQDGSLSDFQNKPASPFASEFLNAQRTLVTL